MQLQICVKMSELSTPAWLKRVRYDSESQGETFLDEDGWKSEARGVIKEICDYVKYVGLSELLPSSSCQVFLNLTTLEEVSYTVLLNERGFSVVGDKVDSRNREGETVYETPHALLDNLSPAYRQAFGDHLTAQLLQLQQQQDQEN